MPERIECPWCGMTARAMLFTPLRRPPGREHQFAWEFLCPSCRQKFAPKDAATVAG